MIDNLCKTINIDPGTLGRQSKSSWVIPMLYGALRDLSDDQLVSIGSETLSVKEVRAWLDQILSMTAGMDQYQYSFTYKMLHSYCGTGKSYRVNGWTGVDYQIQPGGTNEWKEPAYKRNRKKPGNPSGLIAALTKKL